MSQRDRDRLVVLRKAEGGSITQEQAATELGLTTRQVRRLLLRLKKDGDRAVPHGLRGRPSNRKTDGDVGAKVVEILSREVYRDFGPTLASEYLAEKHGIRLGREGVRRIMSDAGLWTPRRAKAGPVHQWRERRNCRGELIQWDTSTHDWLEGRGERMYLVHMVDDATSQLTARFVPRDSTECNMGVLRLYLERHGRPLAFYTDKAGLFQTSAKNPRDAPRDQDQPELPPTQITRALGELAIARITAHSPQAKGRVERSFQTAQDRLVKGLRVAGVSTMEGANEYLEREFVPWWNGSVAVEPANGADAHRALEKGCDLDAILAVVETRQVANDYTFRFQGRLFQIARADVRPGLRGGQVRVEARFDGTVHARFKNAYVAVEERQPQPKQAPAPRLAGMLERAPTKPTDAAKREHARIMGSDGTPLWKAAKFDQTRQGGPDVK